jgi:hypothetical protein
MAVVLFLPGIILGAMNYYLDLIGQVQEMEK